jgi:hypothetical protein
VSENYERVYCARRASWASRLISLKLEDFFENFRAWLPPYGRPDRRDPTAVAGGDVAALPGANSRTNGEWDGQMGRPAQHGTGPFRHGPITAQPDLARPCKQAGPGCPTCRTTGPGTAR